MGWFEAYRLRNGWAYRAQTLWDDRGHVREHPFEGIFWIRLSCHPPFQHPPVAMYGTRINCNGQTNYQYIYLDILFTLDCYDIFFIMLSSVY